MQNGRPAISVVIPCLNEEEAVGHVIDEAWAGIEASGRPGEVVVVDNNSTDRSAEVAAAHGATVVHETRPGYGSAYLAGFEASQGDFIVMADADATYPLKDLGPFVDRLAEGDDLVMGSRFEGTIHGDAMPWLNRNVGNPILTGMLNVLFGVKISDAHCGMRAVRRDALPRLDLHSTGMEFASEMVFKAYRRDLKVSEIPIDYYPRVGESKLNRFGDAWRHVRFMLLYSPSWLFLVPGGVMFLLGLLGMAVLATGPVDVFGRTWQIHTLFACIALTLLGGQIVELWTFARTFARARLGERDTVLERIAPHVSLERGIVLGLTLMGLGSLGVLRVLIPWVSNGFGALAHEYLFAVALMAFGFGVEVIFASFFLALLTMRTTEARAPRPAMERRR
jgi:glycosyltransferase involved in cell wall biosynthesis